MPSCYLVGHGAIALRCVELLRLAGFRILGVFSHDRSLQSWAKTHFVTHETGLHNLKEGLLEKKHDYLFSVNNPWIIPLDILNASGTGTINFHDSPLPRYGGLHATSWALLGGETEHAICWHEVAPEIDAGDIYRLATFPITVNDTAYSLNNKALSLAAQEFEHLIELIEKNQILGMQQSGSKSYFGRDDRPLAACLFDPLLTPQALDRLARALDFGPVYNPLGLLKLRLPSDIACIGGLRIDAQSSQESGRILSIAPNDIHVSVTNGSVHLFDLRTFSGNELDVTTCGLRVGDELPLFNQEELASLTLYNRQAARQDRYWAQQLLDVEAFVHPLTGVLDGSESLEHRVELPWLDSGENGCFQFLAYCAQLAQPNNLDIGWFVDELTSAQAEIFSSIVPIRLSSCDARVLGNLANFISSSRNTVRDVAGRKSFCRDLPLRQPGPDGDAVHYGVVVARARASQTLPRLQGALVFVHFEDARPSELRSRCAHAQVALSLIAEQLRVFCAEAARCPDQDVSKLSLLSSEDRQQVLYAFNDTESLFPDKGALDLIIAQSFRTPHAPALTFGENTWTYHQLLERADTIARSLQDAGVLPQAVVALCVPRCHDTVAGILGIIKAGAIYLPIDIETPHHRVRELLKTSQALVLLAQTGDYKDRDDMGVPLIKLDTLKRENTLPLASFPKVHGSDPMYLIFTSGSTGSPKGVLISHRSLVNHSWAIGHKYALGPGDRMLQSASIAFDVAAEQIFPPLLRGAEVVVRPDNLLNSFDRFGEFTQGQKITAMILPTSFWHEWSAHLHRSNLHVPESLRILSVGTEKVHSEKFACWQEVSRGKVRFFQGYGPTEATVTCTMYEHDNCSPLEKQSASWLGQVPIGKPIANTTCYVLDRNLVPVPLGMPGDLYVGGAGLAISYFNDNEQTSDKFVDNPFVPGTRMYRTGDVVRWTTDGQLLFEGRLDNQVKIRGYRVELAEVETQIRGVSGVRDAVVLVCHSPARALAAFYLGEVEPAELQLALKTALPHYMIPSHVQRLKEFPVTRNHKIDRAALHRRVTISRPCTQLKEKSDVLTTAARRTAKLWLELLGVAPQLMSDSFFELGGDSLLAIRMFTEFERVSGQRVDVAQFFQTPTIDTLLASSKRHPPSSKADTAAAHSQVASLVPLQAEGSGTPLYMLCGVGLYKGLAQALGSKHPTWGVFLPIEAKLIEDYAKGSELRELPTVEALAADYVRVIQEHQTEGPYWVGGVSFGGVLAFEVAQQLLRAGHEVAPVLLLDSALPGAWKFKWSSWFSHYAQKSNYLEALSGDKIRATIRKKLTKIWQKRRTLHEFLGEVPRARLDNFEDLRGHAYLKASQKYELSVRNYRGDVLLIRARDHVGDTGYTINSSHGWESKVEGRLRVQTVSGDHLGILSMPHVTELASAIQELMIESSRKASS